MVFKKGNIPWCTGLKRENDKRLPAYWLGKKRPDISERMKGENNPSKRVEVREKLKGTKGNNHWTKSGKYTPEEIKEKIGKNRKGKNYEEIFGIERAEEIRKKLSEKRNQRVNLDGKYNHTHKTKETLRNLAYKRKPKYKDTKPELILQNALLKENVKFETNKYLFGRPDIFIQPNICIFVDGEYWHNYPSLRDIDLNVNEKLEKLGYIVLRFWVDNEIYKDLGKVLDKIKKYILL